MGKGARLWRFLQTLLDKDTTDARSLASKTRCSPKEVLNSTPGHTLKARQTSSSANTERRGSISAISACFRRPRVTLLPVDAKLQTARAISSLTTQPWPLQLETL